MGNKMTAIATSIKFPVVVVLGATGTGKSKLAIQIAKTFNGEVISADSMQVYRGLDIVTNKVTADEQNEVVHHFIGTENPLDRYTVVDFQNRALPIIKNLHKESKLPIIVGGTNYYIESLLWDVLIKQEEAHSDTLLLEKEKYLSSSSLSSDEENQTPVQNNEDLEEIMKRILSNVITHESHKDVSSALLHKVLTKVDPNMADQLHPNDRRKILRSLQIYQHHKCSHTELIQQQKAQKGGSSLGGPIRYKDSVMLWVHCDRSVLHKRLDDRVDQMVVAGLIEELLEFHRAYNDSRLKSGKNKEEIYEEGIFQSIGFKEFHEYLLLSTDERNSENGTKMLQKGIQNMKIATRQYARKQVKWITNRFLKKPDRDVPPVYMLNASDLDEWDEHVYGLACNIIDSMLRDKKSGILPLAVEERVENIKETHYCDICQRIIVGKATWEIHLKSRTHYKRKKSVKRSGMMTILNE